MAGGFSTEDHIFKVIAMGAPYFKAVCLGRALMVPGFVGDNIADVLAKKNGRNWDALPNTVSQYGAIPEQIFAGWSALQERFGKDVSRIPLGAVAISTFVDKLRTGLTQFMAGARSFRLDSVNRNDIIALTEDAEKVSGISYIMDAFQEDAEKILDS
jgi:glutamate synthase domain-containing protein 2